MHSDDYYRYDFQVCNRIYSKLRVDYVDNEDNWQLPAYLISDLVTDEIYSPKNTLGRGHRILSKIEFFFDLADCLTAPT